MLLQLHFYFQDVRGSPQRTRVSGPLCRLGPLTLPGGLAASNLRRSYRDVKTTSECLDYLAEGYEYEHSLKRSYFIPSEIYLNKILMLTTLIYCFYFSLYERKIKL